LTAASSPKPITTSCSVLPPEIVTHDAYIGRRFWRTKITRKASDVAENLQLYQVVQFFHLRLSYIGRRSENNIKCMIISGGRTKLNNSIYSAVSLALRVIFSVS